jgi:hypothetical protein
LKGNHDDELRKSDFKNYNFTFIDDVYIQGNVRYQHGHQYDLWNAPGKEIETIQNFKDPSGIRSFGYYVSRSVSHAGGNVSMIPSIAKYFCRNLIRRFPVLLTYLVNDEYNSVFLKNLLDTALKGSLMGKIKGLSSYSIHRNQIIKGGCFWMNKNKSVQLGLAVRKYNGLIKRLLMQYPPEYVSNMIAGTCNDFSHFISHFNERIVILGHTHIHSFLHFMRDSSIGGGKIT